MQWRRLRFFAHATGQSDTVYLLAEQREPVSDGAQTTTSRRRSTVHPGVRNVGAADGAAGVDHADDLSFQGSWNEFPHTLVAVQDPALFTLPRGLADLVGGSLGVGTQYPLKLGAALLATIPVAVILCSSSATSSATPTTVPTRANPSAYRWSGPQDLPYLRAALVM